MSNQCPYCGSFRNVCVSPVSFRYVCLACEKFFCKGGQPKPTVFDRITASPEVLAPYLVFFSARDNGWCSMLTMGSYDTYKEAIAATVAKLKEVADA